MGPGFACRSYWSCLALKLFLYAGAEEHQRFPGTGVQLYRVVKVVPGVRLARTNSQSSRQLIGIASETAQAR